MIDLPSLYQKIKTNKLAKDSFWSIFGNGLGNLLLLIAGIIIARFLGKDLYGEYGIVKTTMFYIAAFSTFGLGYTSTKFISEYKEKDTQQIRAIILASFRITLISSVSMCILLFVFAQPLANFINASQLATPFRFLGLILICRALSTTGAGLLAGLKKFKELGINNIISGIVMFGTAILFTYYWGLKGALLSLLLSQLCLSVLNLILVGKSYKEYPFSDTFFTKKLLTFSFPVALQELSFTICNWGAMLILTKYASLGELGIYSATTQWNAIILFIPGLLANVILSYLSENTDDTQKHRQIIKRMLFINFITAFIPFLIVFILSGIITSMYGSTFHGMQAVLNITIFQTIITTLTNVFQSNLISMGLNWLLFTIRVSRDLLILFCLYITLNITNGYHAALNFAIINLIIATITLGCYLLLFRKYSASPNS